MYPEISVVILCYKAGQRTYNFVDRIVRLLNRSIPSWEIILVGNYFENSNDETPNVVKDIASKNKNIKAMAIPKQGMMGWDARNGLAMATGNYICIIDGDEQMSYRDIVRVYRKIKKEDLDFVKTYRAKRFDGTIRIIVSFIYNIIFILLFPGIKASDVNSKPKIIKKEILHKMNLTSNDWFFDAEMMIQVRRLKLKIGLIPAKFYKCNYRNSFVKFSAIFEFIKNLLYARFKEFFI